MQINTITYELGNRIVTNEQLIEHVKECSPNFQGEAAELETVLTKLFDRAGCTTRRWCETGQRPIDMITRALSGALEQAQLEKNDIELIIHAGLGRGFLEAGQSYFVAKSMGMTRAHCFDVMDACQSWVRSMMIARSLLASRQYSRIAIVNTECNQLSGGIANPSCFQLESLRDLDYCFPGMTLADGVSATIVQSSERRDDGWDFHFDARPELADACAVPVHHWDQFSQPSYLLALNGEGKFTCFGKKLNSAGKPISIELLGKFRSEFEETKLIFAHGHSTFWENWAEEAYQIDRRKLRWNTFPEIGNLASACVPVAMRMAEDAGAFGAGDKAIIWMGSGGMSFSATRFTR